MNHENLKYNILVIDDDPLVLEDAVLMYRDMIFLGDFDDILGKGSEGVVSSAENTKAAGKVLQANFEKDPKLVQLLHVDERMPEERGSEFVDRMRWVYAGRRIGALLVTGYATDVSVINSREKGVYRYISKPVTPTLIKPHLDDLVKVIFSREKPKKRPRENTFVFKVIDNKKQFEEYLQLRYAVYDFMNYIPPALKMQRSRLEADKFDKNAIPFGGFEIFNEKQKLVATSRLIFREKQEPYNTWIKEILIENGERDILDAINVEPEVGFPSEENYLLTEYYEKTPNAFDEFCEISRMTTHFDYRGLDLSRKMIEMAIGLALKKGCRYAVGGNTPQHMSMYRLYGYAPIALTEEYINNKDGQIKDGDLLFFESVAQVAHIAVSDFTKLPEPANKNVIEWRRFYSGGSQQKIVSAEI
ncbi:MAG: hypothetical protein U5R49_16325 [Deltaproteobacteria bacterium]|nr:hypothetical protein [Deltaproteobacteria bacterium]